MTTPNHDTELEEILDVAIYNLKTSPDEMFDKGVKASTMAALHTYIETSVTNALIADAEAAIAFVKDMGDMGDIPLHAAILPYWEYRLEGLRKAAAERWGQE